MAVGKSATQALGDVAHHPTRCSSSAKKVMIVIDSPAMLLTSIALRSAQRLDGEILDRKSVV